MQSTLFTIRGVCAKEMVLKLQSLQGGAQPDWCSFLRHVMRWNMNLQESFAIGITYTAVSDIWKILRTQLTVGDLGDMCYIHSLQKADCEMLYRPSLEQYAIFLST